MKTPSSSPKARLIQLVWGYRVSQAIYVAARLGIADQLSAGPRDVYALARGCGADAPTLGRLLRALASTGVFRQLRDGRVAHSPLSRCLVRGRTASIADATVMWMEDHYTAWAELLHAVRTGRSAFPRAHGASFYDFLARDRGAATRFRRAISELTSQEARAVVPDYDFGGARTIVDVGGGQGDLLAAILESAPGTTGVLFDLPAVVRAARARLRREPTADRLRFVAGDFFRSVPRGADLFLLRWVLHNWSDADGIRILRNCRRAMTPAARLLVIEEILPDRTRADWPHASAALGDLNMLVLLGGQERTREEYAQLFARAGLRLLRVAQGEGYALLETAVAGRGARGRNLP